MIIAWKNSSNFAYIFLLSIILLANSISIQAQHIAFPGAEGFGKYATGGRGGQVIKVTNLNDDGSGSLREAITKDFPRIIVFEVSGTIYLKSRLKISNGDVTIAGQTAPGHGITLAHYNFYVQAENVIIRHIRSRLSAAAGQQDDAFSCVKSTNVIVDHCSFSWSVDEVASTYDNKNFTMQNCIIAESFHHSIHEKGAHGYGGIWGGASASFHHNLIMHNTSRNPRFCGSRYTNQSDMELIDHRNNVIYNWGGHSCYGAEGGSYNIVNNYYKYGPATSSGVKDRIISPNADDGSNSQPAGVWGKFYVNGNYVYGSPENTTDNWLGVDNVSASIEDAIKSDTAFAYDITTIHTAEEAYNYVITNAGTTIPTRDTVDRRLIWEVVNDTALYGGKYGDHKGIVDNLDDVGGYPKLFSDWAPMDTDADGLPDSWEIDNGLDPNNPDDNQTILEGKTYPAIEEYINSMIASNSPFMFQPTNLIAELTQIKEINLWWEDNTDDETAYLVWRSEGDDFTCFDTLSANTTFYSDTNVVFDKTYLYKLQAINATDSSVFSNDAEASTLGADGKPKPAEDPSPAHGANNISTTVNLSWKQGVGSKNHDVYLGTTSSPSFVANVEETSFTIENLKDNTRYYWRVDEVNENGATEGATWNFVTRTAFPQDLIAHFSFNQPILVNDVSGNGINGKGYNIRTPDFVEGVYGKAIDFDGSTQYCEYPHNEKVNFDINAFTISFWIKQDLNTVNKSNSHRYIVKGSNVKNETSGHSGKRYEVYYTPDKNIFRFSVDDNVTKSEVTADENYFLKNDWVHVVAIRDTTTKKIKLYANAELVGEVDDITGNIAQNEHLFISYCVDETAYVDGTMDEVQLYGYALPQNTIDSLYQLGSVGIVKETVTQQLALYPNPAKEKISINLNSTKQQIQTVKIYNILGELVKQVNAKESAATHKIDIDTSDLMIQSHNIFLVMVSTNKKTYSTKLIIE